MDESYKSKDTEMRSVYIFGGALIGLMALVMCYGAYRFNQYAKVKRAHHHAAPIIKDVNGDGVNDIIWHKNLRTDPANIPRNGLEYRLDGDTIAGDTLYGVKDGRRMKFMPKEQFMEHYRKYHSQDNPK
jgi:hypothetical protein